MMQITNILKNNGGKIEKIFDTTKITHVISDNGDFENFTESKLSKIPIVNVNNTS